MKALFAKLSEKTMGLKVEVLKLLTDIVLKNVCTQMYPGETDAMEAIFRTVCLLGPIHTISQSTVRRVSYAELIMT